MKNEKIEMSVTEVLPSIEDVKLLIGDALNHLYKNDFSLMDYETEDKAVSERCMVFRIGWYILNYMNQHHPFDGWC